MNDMRNHASAISPKIAMIHLHVNTPEQDPQRQESIIGQPKAAGWLLTFSQQAHVGT